MIQLPERVDITEAEKACDYLMHQLRTHAMNDDMQTSVLALCRYVQRTKASQKWLEVVIEAHKNYEADKNGSTNSHGT
jgi:hypothetical protein